MRLSSGKWGGTRLGAPKGRGTRPTSDRNREALFSMLAARLDFDRLHVLDGFAGSGALGLEALSRGAAQCLFVENDQAACAAIKANIAACGAQNVAVLMRHDMHKARFDDAQFDLVFLDPPYGKGLAEAVLSALRHHLAQNALIVIEEAKRTAFEVPDGFVESDRRVKGDSIFIFLRAIKLYNGAEEQ